MKIKFFCLLSLVCISAQAMDVVVRRGNFDNSGIKISQSSQSFEHKVGSFCIACGGMVIYWNRFDCEPVNKGISNFIGLGLVAGGSYLIYDAKKNKN